MSTRPGYAKHANGAGTKKSKNPPRRNSAYCYGARQTVPFNMATPQFHPPASSTKPIDSYGAYSSTITLIELCRHNDIAFDDTILHTKTNITHKNLYP